MNSSRRGMLHSAAALAAGLAAPGRLGAAEGPVPKMKFGRYEIGRLIVGCNPFYGFSHFNETLSALMREYYTAERVRDVLHRCNRHGIDAFNFFPGGRGIADYRKFVSEGGRMHLIAQGIGDPAPLVRAVHPIAVYHHGARTDDAWQRGALGEVREWCRKVRDLGAMAGVGTHRPRVIEAIEEQGWDVDFYAGCVYERSRTPEEWKQVLGGQVVEMQGECYLQSDPPRMYRTMRATSKPCFAFKILAAGRVSNAEQALRTAFESIKPNDGVFVGLFPKFKDEVGEDAACVKRILNGA